MTNHKKNKKRVKTAAENGARQRPAGREGHMMILYDIVRKGGETQMMMIATVREVRNDSLLVRNRANGQDVVVHTDCTGCFCVGDIVSILFNGIMTNSLPPQITATNIRRIFSRGFCR